MRCGRGFTLTELLMVVVLLAILARMALPQYAKTIERQYWQTAQGVLLTIYAGEQIYYSRNNAFLARGTTDDWTVISMDNPTTATVEYIVQRCGSLVTSPWGGRARRLTGPNAGQRQFINLATGQFVPSGTFGTCTVDWPQP